MVSHEPEEIANDLYEYRRALLDLADLALREDVQKEFDALRDAIADRLAQSGLHDYANRFRPKKGPVALYGPTKGRPMAERVIDEIFTLETVAAALTAAPPITREMIREGLARMNLGRGATDLYVSRQKIDELAHLKPLLVGVWDLSVLIELCEGINVNYAEERYLPVAMMLRAIMDHVPPLFDNAPNFATVASQSRKSESAIYTRMYGAKDISDFWIHQQIRPHISMPGPEVVDIRSDFNFLLDRAIERLRAAVPRS